MKKRRKKKGEKHLSFIYIIIKNNRQQYPLSRRYYCVNYNIENNAILR